MKKDRRALDDQRRLQRLSAAQYRISALVSVLDSQLVALDSSQCLQEKQDLARLWEDFDRALQRIDLAVQRLERDLAQRAEQSGPGWGRQSVGPWTYTRELRAARRLALQAQSSQALTTYNERADSRLAAELRKALRPVEADL